MDYITQSYLFNFDISKKLKIIIILILNFFNINDIFVVHRNSIVSYMPF